MHNNIELLNDDQLEMVDGGTDTGWLGCAIGCAGIIAAVALAPVTAGTSLIAVGACAASLGCSAMAAIN